MASVSAMQTAADLQAAQELLQSSFVPVMGGGQDDGSGDVDLLPFMVAAKTCTVSGLENDYRGCFCLLLRNRAGKPTAAGICRVFGQHLAELPLIATSISARRKVMQNRQPLLQARFFPQQMHLTTSQGRRCVVVEVWQVAWWWILGRLQLRRSYFCFFFFGRGGGYGGLLERWWSS